MPLLQRTIFSLPDICQFAVLILSSVTLLEVGEIQICREVVVPTLGSFFSFLSEGYFGITISCFYKMSVNVKKNKTKTQNPPMPVWENMDFLN